MKKSSKRNYGEGSIVYEADRNKYRAYLTTENGKRITKRFATKKEASQWLAETRTDIYRDEYIPESDITVGGWLIQYLEVYKKNSVRATTYNNYISYSLHYKPIAHIPLQDLNTFALQKFFNELDLAPGSKKTIKSLLKSSLNKAVELGTIKKNPLVGVTGEYVEQKDVQVFSREEIQAILQKIQTFPRYEKFYPLLLFAFYSGARIGEIVGLKIKNVHEDYVFINNSLKSVNGKLIDGDVKRKTSLRNISLPAFVIEALQKAHGNAPTSYVFHDKDNQPISMENLRGYWHRILWKCGVKYRCFHTIRHTHATQLLAAGIPIVDVAYRLGHTPQMTLSTYGHYINDNNKAISDKVKQIFAF